LRALPLVFPNDRKVDNMIYQFMFGENLLVGVFNDSIYLPKGNWVNYWSGQKVKGGEIVHCNVPENRGGPLYIKAGAIIPCQKTMQYISELPVDTLILKVYPEKKSSYTLLEDDGKTFDYEKGDIAKTRFECNETEKNTEFIIHAAEGQYIGIPNRRTYQIEIASSKKPSKIMVNAINTDDWLFDISGKIILIVNQKNRTEKLSINIIL